jgi:hypothetical protein
VEEPLQVSPEFVKDGITVKMPVCALLLELAAVKEISPVPVLAAPMEVFEFIQLYTVFTTEVDDPRSTTTGLLAQTVWSVTGNTSGTGFTEIVNCWLRPEQVMPLLVKVGVT